MRTDRETRSRYNQRAEWPARGTPPVTTTRANSMPRHCWCQGRVEASTPPSEHHCNSHKCEVPTRNTPISSNNLNCLDSSSDSKWETRSSHCFSGYPLPPDTLRPWNPTWHHTRRMMRHCGTRPPPRHLGRTLMFSKVLCDCPGFPSPVTAPAQRHCSSVKNTHTHIHMHPYVKKEQFFIWQWAVLSFLSIMHQFGFAWAAEETRWGQWVLSEDLPHSQQLNFWPCKCSRKSQVLFRSGKSQFCSILTWYYMLGKGLH